MLHHFPLSFSFFFLFLPATANTTYILPYIYLYYIYMCVVRYTDKYRAFLFHSFALLRFFVSVLCVALYLLSERFLSLSLHSSTDPPHPHFTVQNRWLPHSLIFYFFRFQNFLLKKMRYDLFTFMECLCRY